MFHVKLSVMYWYENESVGDTFTYEYFDTETPFCAKGKGWKIILH